MVQDVLSLSPCFRRPRHLVADRSRQYAGLGVGSAVHSEIRSGNVPGLRTGNKCHQSGNLIHMSIAAERGVGNLWRRPIARGRIQVRVNGARLNVIHRNATASHLSR